MKGSFFGFSTADFIIWGKSDINKQMLSNCLVKDAEDSTVQFSELQMDTAEINVFRFTG